MDLWPTVMLSISGSLSALMVGALLAAHRMEGEVYRIIEAGCSAWSFGVDGLGEIITGILVANLLLFACLAVTGLVAVALNSRRVTDRQAEEPAAQLKSA